MRPLIAFLVIVFSASSFADSGLLRVIASKKASPPSGVGPPPITPINWWDFIDASKVTLSGSEITSITATEGAIDLNFAASERPIYRTDAGQNFAAFRGAERGTFSAAISVDKQNHTVFYFGCVHQGGSDTYMFGGASYSFYWRDIGVDHGLALFDTAPRNSITVKLPYTPTAPTPAVIYGVYGNRGQYISSDPSVLYLGDGETQDSTVGPAVSGSSALNYLMARGDGNLESSANSLGILVYEAGLNQSQIAQILDWGKDYYGSYDDTDKSHLIVADGNSLTDGFVGQNYEEVTSWPSQLVTTYNLKGTRIINVGLDGDTVSSDPTAARTVAAFTEYSGFTNNISVFFKGSNDLYIDNDDLATVSASIDAWITSVRTADPTIIIVGCTMIARSPTLKADHVAINDYIKDTADFDHVVDLFANPIFDTAADTANTTYYNADRIHLTDLGYAEVAKDIEATLRAASLLP